MRTNFKALAQNIDSELLEINWQWSIQDGRRDTLMNLLKHADYTPNQGVSYQTELAKVNRAIAELDTTIAALTSVFNVYNWNRAFIVPGGHVHSSMDCHTLHPTTKIMVIPECSALTAAEVVELAGERACTICYPDAPVEVLRRPTKLFTKDEQTEREFKEMQQRERQAKEVAKNDRKVTAIVGGRDKTFASIRTALIEAKQTYENAIYVARLDRNIWKSQVEEKLSNFINILQAVAAHPDNEATLSDLIATVLKKAETAFKSAARKGGYDGLTHGWTMVLSDAIDRVTDRMKLVRELRNV